MSKFVQADSKVIHTKTSLTREQKEAVGLLSIGTFLEYFDLMLYVHMAVLLNELFFPKSDPHTSNLLAASAFCSTYLLRPFGALIFGWLGDNIGRKITVVITTFMMAISCFVMANLPTYDHIGITASCIMIICRMIQGISSMGEVLGAELYLTEAIKPPMQYPAVALITIFCVLGGTFALGLSSFLTFFNLNWRIAFWFGVGIALIGFIARSSLREAPDFANAKHRIQQAVLKANKPIEILEKNLIWKEKVDNKTILAYFFMQCAWPICFYFAFIHCGNVLKTIFHISPTQIIHHNFVVSLIQLLAFCIFTYLSYKIHPLKLLKVRLIIFFFFILISPYLFANINNPLDLLLIQSFILTFSSTDIPAAPIIYKHFPIFKRFTYSSFIYASSRVLMYSVGSFGLIYLVKYFDNWAFFSIMLPVGLGLVFSIRHFENLEIESGNYYQKKTPPVNPV